MPNDSIFISVYFVLEDSLDNIEEIKIIHTESEYEWKIPKEIVQKSNVVWGEKKFAGYSFLEFDNAKSILTGQYQIEVSDSAGNVAENNFFVEVEGVPSSTIYRMPEINYRITPLNKNREIRIDGGSYSSCEIKFLNDPKMFENTRKKFGSDKKIILNKNEPVLPHSRLSVRINKDEDEIFVYFLKVFSFD